MVINVQTHENGGRMTIDDKVLFLNAESKAKKEVVILAQRIEEVPKVKTIVNISPEELRQLYQCLRIPALALETCERDLLSNINNGELLGEEKTKAKKLVMTIDLLLLNKEISYSGNELDKNDIPSL